MKKNIFLLLLSIQGIFAQVQFTARVTKNDLGINEHLRIDFVMNEEGDNFVPPNFDGFRIIGGPNQSVSYQWINGRKSFEKTYSYFLNPLKMGTFEIKPASIEINGQIYKTNPIKIKVGKEVQQNQNSYTYGGQVQQPVKNAGTSGVELVAEVSNSSPYINEPITVVYKIYVSNNSAVGGWSVTDNPKYNNFWSQNIDIKKLDVKIEKYKGEDYRYAILRKTVLYPQKSGKLEIEPLSLDVEVQVATNRYDFFGRPIMSMVKKKVSAGSRVIQVKNLPEAGKPQSFTGAVGEFTFQVKPSKTQLKSEESLELDVTVSGKGNLKLFTLPKPVIPSALEMYDPVHEEKVNTALNGMSGRISDTYTIITQSKGNYPIQPIEFSYFDLKTRSYKTITSNEININVLGGSSASKENNGEDDKSLNKKAVTSNSTFSFIKLKTNLLEKKKEDFLGSNLFYSLLFAPFLLIPLVVFLRRKKIASDNDIIGNKNKLSNKLAKKYLSEAKLQINNKDQFYIALEKAMHNFLKAKLYIETSEMSKDKIREILLSKNVNLDTIHNFIVLTENCELARYSPSTHVTIQQDYDKVVLVLSELEKQIS